MFLVRNHWNSFRNFNKVGTAGSLQMLTLTDHLPLKVDLDHLEWPDDNQQATSLVNIIRSQLVSFLPQLSPACALVCPSQHPTHSKLISSAPCLPLDWSEAAPAVLNPGRGLGFAR